MSLKLVRFGHASIFCHVELLAPGTPFPPYFSSSAPRSVLSIPCTEGDNSQYCITLVLHSRKTGTRLLAEEEGKRSKVWRWASKMLLMTEIFKSQKRLARKLIALRLHNALKPWRKKWATVNENRFLKSRTTRDMSEFVSLI